MASVKPMKTERTHEENQERAYIAASRRSDRSLEARVESARRASEIHKRRTGRSLRVTEQDVVNEEMYEEEDDDLPMQYRRLTAHLQTQNADFDRRLHAYLTNHVAMRTALGQAVSDAWQSNNQGQQGQQGQQYQQNSQFMNPGMMQMQQPGYQQTPMLPPQQQMYNRMPANYRQSPYPVQNQNVPNMRPNWHNRSASIAAPQDVLNYQQQQQQEQQQPQSAQPSPVESAKMEDRRMSLPVQQSPHTPQSQHVASPGQASPVISRNGSTSNLTTGYMKHSQSPQQVPTPPQQQPQHHRQQPMPSPFYASFDHQMNSGMNPFSMSLPMESQQLLAGSPAFDMNEQMTSMFMPSQMPQQQAGMKAEPQRFYSYNPNGKPKGTSNVDHSQTNFNGMNQTLAPGSLDTSVGDSDNGAYMTAPHSAGTDYLNTPFTPAALDMGFGAGFGTDPFKGVASGSNSGEVTPIMDDWSNMLHEDMFASQQTAA
ncbi:hypothetical protein LTR85_000814 [Meristemomyces frigidus]|nr:hypothetical protein LTR85_000814 [Meristemomyces frigidus]